MMEGLLVVETVELGNACKSCDISCDQLSL